MAESKEYSNDWCFSGELVRIQPFKEEGRKDYWGSITIKGRSKNEDNYYPLNCELTIFLRQKAWEELNRKKKCYDDIEIVGHFEQTATKINPIKNIGDMIVA